MTADGARCSGPGGKVLQSGGKLRPAGLKLPTLVLGTHTRFFVGVESATRVCGPWAFNASSVSWFVASSRALRDEASGVNIDPKFLHVAYTHFAHLCVYRTALDRAARKEIAASSGEAGADNGPGGKRGQCFPETSRVVTRRGVIDIARLRVGDEVLASPGVYSRVYAFSHRAPDARATFVRIRARSGEKISLTPGHLLYANGKLVPSVQVQTGDMLTLASGRQVTVVSVDAHLAKGLFAPHTLHGDIVIDGIAASSFTEAIRPAAAHALLAPLRAKAPVLQVAGQMLALVQMGASKVGAALIALPRPAASM